MEKWNDKNEKPLWCLVPIAWWLVLLSAHEYSKRSAENVEQVLMIWAWVYVVMFLWILYLWRKFKDT